MMDEVDKSESERGTKPESVEGTDEDMETSWYVCF